MLAKMNVTKGNNDDNNDVVVVDKTDGKDIVEQLKFHFLCKFLILL